MEIQTSILGVFCVAVCDSHVDDEFLGVVLGSRRPSLTIFNRWSGG